MLLFVTGVDPLIATFEMVQMRADNKKWVRSVQRRIHDHDVRALAFCHGRLFSGGLHFFSIEALSVYYKFVYHNYGRLLTVYIDMLPRQLNMHDNVHAL